MYQFWKLIWEIILKLRCKEVNAFYSLAWWSLVCLIQKVVSRWYPQDCYRSSCKTANADKGSFLIKLWGQFGPSDEQKTYIEVFTGISSSFLNVYHKKCGGNFKYLHSIHFIKGNKISQLNYRETGFSSKVRVENLPPRWLRNERSCLQKDLPLSSKHWNKSCLMSFGKPLRITFSV